MWSEASSRSPLLLDHGGIEPIGELLEEIGAGFRGTSSWFPMPRKTGRSPKGTIWFE